MKLQNNANIIQRNLGNTLTVSQENKLELVILNLMVVMWNILVANDNEDKANAFGDYFAGVYTHESDNVLNELPSRHSAAPCEDVVFTEEAILDKLTSIKINKSRALICCIPGFYMRQDTN